MNVEWWMAIGEGTGAAMLVGGVLLGILRASLGRSFVTHTQHKELEVQLALVETRFDTRSEAYEKRIGALETGAAGIAATLQGVKESVSRVEHMTTLLVQHQLDQEKAST